MKWHNLYGRLLSYQRLYEAWLKVKSKRISSSVGVAILLITQFITPPATLAQTTTTQPQTQSDVAMDVSPKEAQAAAIFQVLLDQHTNPNSSWNGKVIHAGSPIPVFDRTGLTSYIVNLVSAGQGVGYVEVSATKSDFLVLSFAKSSSEMSAPTIFTLTGRRIERNKGIQSNEIVKVGPVAFGVKLNYPDGTGEVIGQNVRELLNSQELAPIPKHVVNQSTQARDMWNEIGTIAGAYDFTGNTSDRVTGDLSFETGTHTYYSLDSQVDDWQQEDGDTQSEPWIGWSGCSPTAASDIIYYWQAQEPSLPIVEPATSQWSAWQNTVEQLRQCMQTFEGSNGDGLTYETNIGPGITYYLSNRGVSNPTAYNYTMVTDWYIVQNAVANGHPDEISMVNQTYYCPGTNEGHSVCGVGWDAYTYNGSSTGHQYIEVHNNQNVGPMLQYMAFGRDYDELDVTEIVPF